LDLFAELRAASSSQPDLPPERLVEGVTVKGARALQRAGELGELQPDFLADLIVIPFRGPSEHAALSVVQHVGPVTASMIGGRWVLPPPGEGNDPSGVTD
jgi:cytosine/adenosine deaminase-related metal-dependent hydrolase